MWLSQHTRVTRGLTDKAIALLTRLICAADGSLYLPPISKKGTEAFFFAIFRDFLAVRGFGSGCVRRIGMQRTFCSSDETQARAYLRCLFW